MKIASVAAIVALGGLLFGYNTGVISGALLFLRPAFSFSDLMLGVVTSMALAGAAVGAAGAGPAADRFGRRPSLLCMALVFVAGAALSATAYNLISLLAGRLLVGFGIGAASMLTPLYLSEVATARQRGAFVSLNQLAMTVGILVSNLVGFGFAAAGGWRWMLGLGGAPALILALGMMALPETPRWLIGRGRNNEAAAVLRRLRGPDFDVLAEMRELPPVHRDIADRRSVIWFARPGVRLPLIVGIGLAILQQATGINTVIYFAPVIFRGAGLSSASAAILATAGVGLVNVLLTLVAMWLVDRAGRRPLLLAGLLGMGVSLLLLALGFMLGTGITLGVLTAASLAAYVGCFAVGLGPVFWLLISEIFPSEIRGRAMAAATAANWLANLVVALTFLDCIDLLGRPGVFFIYAALAFAALLFSWKWVPETTGLDLATIESRWGAGAISGTGQRGASYHKMR